MRSPVIRPHQPALCLIGHTHRRGRAAPDYPLPSATRPDRLEPSDEVAVLTDPATGLCFQLRPHAAAGAACAALFPIVHVGVALRTIAFPVDV